MKNIIALMIIAVAIYVAATIMYGLSFVPFLIGMALDVMESEDR